MGNLDDYATFDPTNFDVAKLHEIDLWALGQLNAVIRDVTAHYEAFEFYRAYQRIYQFCAVDLSSFYLDVLKDRLYAELPNGPDRQAAQYVLSRLHEVLTILLAPIIPHTADELWDFLPDRGAKPASVHLADWPEADARWDDADRDDKWNYIHSLRNMVHHNLEVLRKDKSIGNSQEGKICFGPTHPEHHSFIESNRSLLSTVFIISEVEIDESWDNSGADADRPLFESLPHLATMRSTYPKCERCWNLRPTVGQDAEHPTLCARCSTVINALVSA